MLLCHFDEHIIMARSMCLSFDYYFGSVSSVLFVIESEVLFSVVMVLHGHVCMFMIDDYRHLFVWIGPSVCAPYTYATALEF